MSAFDEIKALLDTMANRQGELQKFENLLSEVAVAMQEIVGLMERPAADQGIASAIVEGLKGLSLKAPDVVVNVPAPVVNVPAPQVTVMPAAAGATPTGWVLTITSRDGSGAIRSLSFKPEN